MHVPCIQTFDRNQQGSIRKLLYILITSIAEHWARLLLYLYPRSTTAATPRYNTNVLLLSHRWAHVLIFEVDPKRQWQICTSFLG